MAQDPGEQPVLFLQLVKNTSGSDPLNSKTLQFSGGRDDRLGTFPQFDPKRLGRGLLLTSLMQPDETIEAVRIHDGA